MGLYHCVWPFMVNCSFFPPYFPPTFFRWSGHTKVAVWRIFPDFIFLRILLKFGKRITYDYFNYQAETV